MPLSSEDDLLLCFCYTVSARSTPYNECYWLYGGFILNYPDCWLYWGVIQLFLPVYTIRVFFLLLANLWELRNLKNLFHNFSVAASWYNLVKPEKLRKFFSFPDRKCFRPSKPGERAGQVVPSKILKKSQKFKALIFLTSCSFFFYCIPHSKWTSSQIIETCMNDLSRIVFRLYFKSQPCVHKIYLIIMWEWQTVFCFI